MEDCQTPCVIPVAAQDAIAWAAGRLDDKDLILRSPLRSEAVWILALPSRTAYRAALALCAHQWTKGAVMLICYTTVPQIAAHLIGWGCQETWPGRYVAGPAAFSAWMQHLTRKTHGHRP